MKVDTEACSNLSSTTMNHQPEVIHISDSSKCDRDDRSSRVDDDGKDRSHAESYSGDDDSDRDGEASGNEGEELVVLETGKMFQNVYHFREAVRIFSIQNGFNLKRYRWESNTSTLGCQARRCPWFIHGEFESDEMGFMVKTYFSTHNCQRVMSNKSATDTWIAEQLIGSFRNNPTISISEIREELMRRFQVEVSSEMKLYRVRRKIQSLLLNPPSNGPKVYQKNPNIWSGRRRCKRAKAARPDDNGRSGNKDCGWSGGTHSRRQPHQARQTRSTRR